MVACIKRCEVTLQSQSRHLIRAHCDIPIADIYCSHEINP